MTMFTGLFGSSNAKDKSKSPVTAGGSPTRRLSSSATTKPGLIPIRPPFPHPLPHKKLKVVDLGKDGILLCPETAHYRGRAALVAYGRGGTVRLLEDYDGSTDKEKPSCTAYGVVGILKLFQETYLLVISTRRSVGSYVDSDKKSINCLTGILPIPLSDAKKAREVIEAHTHAQKSDPFESAGGKKRNQLSDISESASSSSDTSDSELETSGNVPSASNAQEKLPNAIVLAEGGEQAKDQISDPSASKQTAAANKGHSKAKPSLSLGLGKLFWSSPSHKSADSPSELISLAGTATAPVSAVPQNGNTQAGVQAAGSIHSSPPEQVVPATSLNYPEAESMRELDRKILREAIAELTNGGIYYSHDFDLTRCTQTRWEQLKEEKLSARQASQSPQNKLAKPKTSEKQSDPATDDSVEINMRIEEPRTSTPLTQRADRRFWWNNWISKPFLDAGLDEFATVLMQGFAQVQHVDIVAAAGEYAADKNTTDGASAPAASAKLSLTVISRRSVERPGLRYQRRGINNSGGVANFVETEFLISTELAGKHHVSSYVQTRGSIPLFWSQSPWSLKPVPVLERSETENEAAITKHFDKQTKNYFGKNIIVNLAEQSGKEGLVVKAYKDNVSAMQRQDVKYTEWDFHHQCRGMKYERISVLLDELASDIDSLRLFWTMDSRNLALQRGVFRTNCMDCLDRTNVVQSALARNNLTTFLTHLGVGPLTTASQEKLEIAFNGLFADNGDAISREYAGTSALKGDFVRSGKRNWVGQLNDATNSVARYWQNTVLDFFKQSMIDYLLGINLNAFAEFSEKMQATDPGEIVRLKTIRKAAVDTATATAVSEGETRLHGWTVLSPAEIGQVKGVSYEEKIVLVTNKALYCCSFEYTLQKVREFVRIPLGQIVGLQKGEYILSALDSSARNVEENFGFLVRYLAEGSTSRSRTYSIRNKSPASTTGPAEEEPSEALRIIAFKALRKDLVRDLDTPSSEISMSSRSQVDMIVEQIRQACEEMGGTSEEDTAFVQEEAVVSLAEAKNTVGILDRLNHELKHLIWL